MTEKLKFRFAKPNEIHKIAMFHASANCALCPEHTARKKREEWVDNARHMKSGNYRILLLTKRDNTEDLLAYMAFEDDGKEVRLKEVCTPEAKYEMTVKQFEKLMAMQLSLYLQKEKKTIYGQDAAIQPQAGNLKQLLVLSALPRLSVQPEQSGKVRPVVKALYGPYIQ